MYDIFFEFFSGSGADIPVDNLRRMAVEFAEYDKEDVFVSCWHESDYESEAMWKLYSSEKTGISVKTNWASLVDSLIEIDRELNTDEIILGRVQYVSAESELADKGSRDNAYLIKRKSFEHEREVRGIIRRDVKSRSEEKERTSTSRLGVYCAVDLDVLVQEVVVDPYAEQWFVELVRSVASRYRLKAPVRKSDLSAPFLGK